LTKLSSVTAKLNLGILIWIDTYTEKDKVASVHAMKACRGMEVYNPPPFLTLALDVGEWSALCLIPVNRKVGGLQNWCGHFGEQKNPLPLLRI
jgi:hypothetical protein